MQVGIDVKCMHTDFGGHDLSGFRDIVGGHDLSGFRDIATLKNGQISLSGHGL